MNTVSAADHERSVEVIELDVSRTFPQLCIFQKVRSIDISSFQIFQLNISIIFVISPIKLRKFPRYYPHGISHQQQFPLPNISLLLYPKTFVSIFDSQKILLLYVQFRFNSYCILYRRALSCLLLISL